MNGYTPSDAAKAYSKGLCTISHPNHRANCLYETSFDAGIAHERESRKPRTITTASELDALPKGATVLDSDGWSWQKRPHDGRESDLRWFMVGCEGSTEASRMEEESDAFTLLVPASAAPEPVRLTADDPRWKDGAKVRGEFADGSAVEGAVDGKRVLYAQIQPSLGTFYWERAMFDVIYLLAEAPADPVDPRVELLAAALHYRGGCEDEWPKCAISTLEHYRNAARNLLPILDGARADQ